VNTRCYRFLAIALGLSLTLACSYLAPRERAAGPSVVDGGILFRYYAPTASRVQLAGDWPENNWARGDGSAGEADIGLMSDADGDGVWEITVALGPGRYQYIFWVNEATWRLDPGNPEEATGGPAGTASLLTVFMRNGRLESR
jgi:1,4-alpha-glucan branching enzyme